MGVRLLRQPGLVHQPGAVVTGAAYVPFWTNVAYVAGFVVIGACLGLGFGTAAEKPVLGLALGAGGMFVLCLIFGTLGHWR